MEDLHLDIVLKPQLKFFELERLELRLELKSFQISKFGAKRQILIFGRTSTGSSFEKELTLATLHWGVASNPTKHSYWLNVIDLWWNGMVNEAYILYNANDK